VAVNAWLDQGERLAEMRTGQGHARVREDQPKDSYENGAKAPNKMTPTSRGSRFVQANLGVHGGMLSPASVFCNEESEFDRLQGVLSRPACGVRERGPGPRRRTVTGSDHAPVRLAAPPSQMSARYQLRSYQRQANRSRCDSDSRISLGGVPPATCGRAPQARRRSDRCLLAVRKSAGGNRPQIDHTV
jgi:hypothetical protein